MKLRDQEMLRDCTPWQSQWPSGQRELVVYLHVEMYQPDLATKFVGNDLCITNCSVVDPGEFQRFQIETPFRNFNVLNLQIAACKLF